MIVSAILVLKIGFFHYLIEISLQSTLLGSGFSPESLFPVISSAVFNVFDSLGELSKMELESLAAGISHHF